MTRGIGYQECNFKYVYQLTLPQKMTDILENYKLIKLLGDFTKNFLVINKQTNQKQYRRSEKQS